MTTQTEYDAHLAADDERLAQMEADGADQVGPNYTTLWNDRMSYAHNCQPDVYVTELADVEPEAAELQRLHSPMAEPEPLPEVEPEAEL